VGIESSLDFPYDGRRFGKRSDPAGPRKVPASSASQNDTRRGCSAGTSQDDTRRGCSAGTSQVHTRRGRSAGTSQVHARRSRSVRTSQDDAGCSRSVCTGQAAACRSSSATRAGKDSPGSHGSSGANEGSADAGQDHTYAPRLSRFQPSHSVADDDAGSSRVDLFVKSRAGIDPISVGSIPAFVLAVVDPSLDKGRHTSQLCSRVTYVALIAYLARMRALASLAVAIC
jgi:hypothetical protein